MTSLADRAPSAEGNAFLAALHAEHRVHLLRFTRGLLPTDPHRAEDVVQECLFRAWRNSETLIEKRIPPRPWLFRVARNLVVDWARRDKARPVVFGDDDFDLLPGDTDFADEVLERHRRDGGRGQQTVDERRPERGHEPVRRAGGAHRRSVRPARSAPGLRFRAVGLRERPVVTDSPQRRLAALTYGAEGIPASQKGVQGRGARACQEPAEPAAGRR
ncbi:sigma factor [Amycolatopsis thailandensis]|uniref:sigma factor n=1 Tax=Amycolatopsis thailandensis TaxID=589330 RepID=UPI0036382EAA